jgi:hypothetical protein
MIETVILAAEAVAEPTVVTPFEEALLGGVGLRDYVWARCRLDTA